MSNFTVVSFPAVSQIFMGRYQTLIKIKGERGKCQGVKRQLVSLCYHSVNQRDENDDMKLIIMYSIVGIAFMKDETA